MTVAWARTIFAQPDQGGPRQQLGQVAATHAKKLPSAGGGAAAEGGRPGNMAFPPSHWQQLHSANTLERLNWETGRRYDVVGIFPNREAIVRLVGAVLAEQNDEWVVTRRYMAADALAQARASQRNYPVVKEGDLLVEQLVA